ncbi:MAG: GNAT family N-acetyltransferase [Roseibium sp.]|uniref:GNAT family N-acetyltransferase n=1 Tax=Roseibium sp. TaxID=1936156 RepID=UPI00262A3C95|nr:GNAT family N-acetyltransferase [Roseibium sp.]MCV0426261.1 GNAT family N-acetyltransferase [Roseibium sp.]
MPLKLRAATPADAPVLTDILHRSKASWNYSDDKMAEYRKHWSVTEKTIQSLHMTVAEQDGVPIGFSGLSPKNEGTLLVDFLFVAPEVQRQGIGDLLLTRAEDHARQNDLFRLYLESDAHAGPFYEKRGFQTIATRPSAMSPGMDIPMMEKILPPSVHAISSIEITLSDKPWAFERENETAISTHFQEAQKRIALLWNGRTLKLTNYRFENGSFMGACAECAYASFLAWRDWGAPDSSAYNLFGSAIIRSSDGALLYGVMSEHTATAGQIYPPGGNLDPTDLTATGQVDVAGAISRELEEETGLTMAALDPGEFLVAFDGPRISISRIFDADQTATELRDKIMRFSKASKEQELADIRIIRSPSDLNDPAMVSYARAIGRHLLT